MSRNEEKLMMEIYAREALIEERNKQLTKALEQMIHYKKRCKYLESEFGVKPEDYGHQS